MQSARSRIIATLSRAEYTCPIKWHIMFAPECRPVQNKSAILLQSRMPHDQATNPPAFLWLPHRSFSLLSNCLITRHRLFAKSKSKLNRRLKLALAKLATILIIIIIERVGRASTAGTSRARTGSAGSKKPSTSGCRRGRQQLANLCSSLVSSLPHCLLIAASSSHFDFGSFSLRSTLEFTN